MSQQLRLLDQSRRDLKIRVRVTRMWPSNTLNGDFVCMNMIFLDNQDYHIQAVAFPVVWNALENMIFEGNIYDITNFITRQAIGTVRPVSSNMSIVLMNSSIVEHVPILVSAIPRHKFEIVALAELHNIANSYSPMEDPVYGIDIAGVIKDLEPMKIINTNLGAKRFIRFNLYDGRNLVKVNLWDDKAFKLVEILEENFAVPPIILFSTMKPRFCFGSLQVSSSNASRLYVNIDYEDVRRIRRRLLDQW